MTKDAASRPAESGRLGLEPRRVDVWRVRLDGPMPPDPEGTLSADERRRAASFLFPRHRRAFVRARASLRAILARYLGEGPEHLGFVLGPHGKPELADPKSALRFNLSHSGGLALLAVSRAREVGVDVEALRPVPDAEAIAERFFSPAESAALRLLPTEQRLLAFFRCWTSKEAYLKAIGDGLAKPLDGFDVAVDPGAPARLLRVACDREEARRWSLLALDAGPGYVATLSAAGDGWRAACRDWPEPPCRSRGARADRAAGEGSTWAPEPGLAGAGTPPTPAVAGLGWAPR